MGGPSPQSGGCPRRNLHRGGEWKVYVNGPTGGGYLDRRGARGRSRRTVGCAVCHSGRGRTRSCNRRNRGQASGNSARAGPSIGPTARRTECALAVTPRRRLPPRPNVAQSSLSAAARSRESTLASKATPGSPPCAVDHAKTTGRTPDAARDRFWLNARAAPFDCICV